MFSLISGAYEFLTEFLPVLAVMLLVLRTRNYPGRYFLLVTLFALYLICVFHVTGAGTIYEALDWGLRMLPQRVNLIPFSREIDVTGYILNVVMLMPFGFLVPLIWKKLANPGSILLSGAAFSLLIELSQLMSFRGTDVDDLIMNTLGAGVGFLAYKVWDKLSRSCLQTGAAAKELPAYVLAAYLGRCFLFYYMGLIRLWYGA